MLKNEELTSLWEHLESLRKTLLIVLIIIVSSIALCFVFNEHIVTILKKPLTELNQPTANKERLEYIRIQNLGSNSKKIALPEHSILSKDLSRHITEIDGKSYVIAPGGDLVYAQTIQQELIVLSPMEGILIALKTSFWVGAFLSSPFWLLVLSRFFLPGLHIHEKKLILPFILTSLACVSIGCLFAFFITIPIANQYLMAFNQNIGTNLWSLGNYLDYTLFLLIANGIAFEFSAIGIFAVQLQILSSETLVSNRRVAIVGSFVMAALLTPPDVLTQFMLAIPLIALYEGLIIYARFQRKIVLKASP